MFCNGYGFAGGNGFGHMGSIGYGWMFMAAGIKLLIFIVLIIAAVKLYKSYSRKSDPSLKILDEKYANGEINEEDYLRKKSVLSQKN